MGAIWLIIKISLYIILVLLSVVIILSTIILISPINYEVYFCKNEQINYDIKIKYLKGIVASFLLQNEEKFHEVKVFGKVVYLDKNEVKIQEKNNVVQDNEYLNDSLVEKDNLEEYTTSANIKDNLILEEINKEEINKEDIDKNYSQNDSQNMNECNKNSNKEKVVDKSKKKEDNSAKPKKEKMNIEQAMGGIKGIKDISICTVKFIKDLLVYISPREYSFEIIVGKDDPADTGELVAKLIMMYPLYYKHGIIRGDYENEGVRGGCLLEGKIRIAGIISIIVRFLLRTPVRVFLKNILLNKKG